MKTPPAIVHPDPTRLTATELALGVVDILGAAIQRDDAVMDVLGGKHRIEYLADGYAGSRIAYADRGAWQTTVVPDRYLRCLPRIGVSS